MFGPRSPLTFLAVLAQSPDGYLWSGADSTTANGIYKDYYEPAIAEGVNNEFPLKDFVEKVDASGDWKGGRGTKWKFHHSRNVSTMATREGAAFALAGKQGYVEGEITQRKIMARVKGTSEVFDDTMSREGAAVSVKKDELSRLIDDIAFREEFYLGSDGRGVLALVDESPSGTTLDVDAPGNVPGDDFGNRFFQEGMFVAAVDPATGNMRTSVREVVSLTADGTGVVFDAATYTLWANNDYLVQAANGSVTDVRDTSYEAAPWGLNALIDDNTNRDNYFGVSRSTYANAKSYVSATTGAISTDLLQRMSDIVYQKLGGKIDRIVCHPSIRRLIIQLTEQDRRYSGASLMKPDPGTAAFKQGDITMGEVPIQAIRSCGLAQLFMLDSKGCGLKRYVAENGKFADEDGSIWVRDGVGTSATDSFEAWYRRRYQLHMSAPGKCARADLITGQTLVVVRSF